MTRSPARTGIVSFAAAALLSIALVGGAAAQVATLAEPGPDTEATPAPVAEDLAGEEALLEWAACMRENGIDMDDPQFSVSGGRFGALRPGGENMAFDPQSSEFQEAMDACGNVLEALRPDLDAEEEAERAEQQLALAECMRARDWDFPDPSAGGGFGAQIRFIEEAGIDVTDPSFQEDITTCQSESDLGFGPPGSEGGVAE